MVEKNVTQRLFGRTVIDSMDINQNAWYIDEAQVTATAAQLNGTSILPATSQTVDVANDEILFLDHSGSHVAAYDSIVDFVAGVAGTSLTATSGQLTVSDKGVTAAKLGADVAGAGLTGGNGVALSLSIPANGIVATNFPIGMVYTAYSPLVDMSDGAAKDVDFGVIGAKGNVVAAYYNMVTATDENVALTVCKSAAGADIVVPAYNLTAASVVYPNVAGGVIFAPGTGSIVSTDHLYVHVPAQAAARAAGTLYVTALIKITA